MICLVAAGGRHLLPAKCTEELLWLPVPSQCRGDHTHWPYRVRFGPGSGPQARGPADCRCVPSALNFPTARHGMTSMHWYLMCHYSWCIPAWHSPHSHLLPQRLSLATESQVCHDGGHSRLPCLFNDVPVVQTSVRRRMQCHRIALHALPSTCSHSTHMHRENSTLPNRFCSPPESGAGSCLAHDVSESTSTSADCSWSHACTDRAGTTL